MSISIKKEKKRGRPSKINKETTNKLCKYISEGNYLDTACKLAGLDYSTMRRWILQGEEDKKGVYFEFANALKLAEAKAEAKRVDNILKAGALGGDWKANAWYLERKYPERWGRKDHIQAEVKSQHTERTELQIEHQLDSDPETVELVRQLWRRQQATIEGQ